MSAVGKRAAPAPGQRDNTPTPRQLEVLALVAGGLTSAEIGKRLGISRSTVETHILQAKARLRARTRAQAAALALAGDPNPGQVEHEEWTTSGHDLVPGCALTCDERRLLDLLAAGQALGEASETLHVSRRTADRRLATAREKLGVRTTAQAVARSGAGVSSN